jgi:bis(5'-adenosyl)-triphosphatase
MVVQDGKEAGQTVHHVHVHIMPRRPGDFARNDDIYDTMESRVDNEARVARTEQDMAEEAQQLSSLFPDNQSESIADE